MLPEKNEELRRGGVIPCPWETELSQPREKKGKEDLPLTNSCNASVTGKEVFFFLCKA